MKTRTSMMVLAALISGGLATAATAQSTDDLQVFHDGGELVCETVAAEFPFEHAFVEVDGVDLAYVDVGEGDPIVLTHGSPTSSYMWRNVIPELAKHGRVIALDAAGHGKSGTPEASYDFADYIASLEGFIEAQGLENVTLVMHDWLPGAAGFEYARRHEDNVKGVAFMETVMAPRFPNAFEDIAMPFQGFMRMVKTPEFQQAVLEQNVFVENMRTEPCGVSDAAIAVYGAPFTDAAQREVLLAYPQTVPVGPDADGPAAEIVRGYSAWLQGSAVPKLMIRAEPGGIMDAESAGEIVKTMPNLSVATVGSVVHFLPETHPGRVGRELAHWYQEISR